MATWAEQGGRDELEPIAPCPFLVRRGQVPDFASRTNILPWQEVLASRPDKWRALTDEAGKVLTELPPLAPSPAGVRITQAVAPHIVDQPAATTEAREDLREVQIWAVFDNLEDDDYKPNGMPKVDVVRVRSGFVDLTGTEIKTMWLAYQASKEEK